MIGRPSGPISITHTHNDSACTFWYPLASRFSHDTTSRSATRTIRIRRDGRERRAEAARPARVAPEIVGPPFAPKRGKVNGFPANGYIAEHNDVTNPTCGRLLASVLEFGEWFCRPGWRSAYLLVFVPRLGGRCQSKFSGCPWPC